LTRALTILDENNTVKYIEYVPEEGKEANIDKALKFLENNLIKK
jgi:thiol peroxidase